MAAGEPEHVRLLVVADWDVGFVLTAHPPLPDVHPGESYVTECTPQRSITFDEVLVEGFSLVQISIDAQVVGTTITDHGTRRLYRLDASRSVETNASVRLHLWNDSDVSRKQKIVTLVREIP